MRVPAPTRTGACAKRVRHPQICVTDAAARRGARTRVCDGCRLASFPRVTCGVVSVTPETTRPRKSRLCVAGTVGACVTGQTQNRPTWPRERRWGGRLGDESPDGSRPNRGLSAPAVLVLVDAAVPALRCGGCRVGRFHVQMESPSSGQMAHFGYARLSRPRGYEAGYRTVRRARHGGPAGPRPNTRPRRTSLLVSRSATVVRPPGRSRHAAERQCHIHTSGEGDRKHKVAPPMFAASEHATEMTRITRGILNSHRDATPRSKGSSRSSLVKSRALVLCRTPRVRFARITFARRRLARVLREIELPD